MNDDTLVETLICVTVNVISNLHNNPLVLWLCPGKIHLAPDVDFGRGYFHFGTVQITFLNDSGMVVKQSSFEDLHVVCA